MSTQQDIEMKLLNDYMSDALRATEPADAVRKTSLYENQVLHCKRQGVSFNESWCEAMIYYIKAIHKLNAQGIIEKGLIETARQSTGFDGIATALLAKGRTEGREREAVSLLDRAISIHPDDADFWHLRASLYFDLKNWQNALQDVEYILSHYSSDGDAYLSARKLKDQIEASKEKSSGCFIATAVYASSDCSELTVLRSYRDDVLLGSPIGRVLVSCYYRISPSIARLISKSRYARNIVRIVILDPIVVTLKRRKGHG